MSLSVKEKINLLKEKNNAVILAHYYVNDDVQEVADFIGDSYYLSKVATTVSAQTIVFCGVTFMGESAKLLNSEKKVLLPDTSAKCAMAEMCNLNSIDSVRKKYDDVAVVCYINSTAKLKEKSDVCVTSANALRIVKSLPNKNIYFIPDENLGKYIEKLVPEKNFIFNNGYCPVHKSITTKDIVTAKKRYKDALILAHPECTIDVLSLADFVGSTSEIIKYVSNNSNKQYLIATEIGVFCELKKQNPNKEFIPIHEQQICSDMKKITLKKVLSVLETQSNEVTISDDVADLARKPLQRMLQI